MNTKEKLDVMQAFLDGKVMEYNYYGVWLEISVEPIWNWDDYTYRIKPQKQLLIPWEHIKPEYKWAAMDEDGQVFVFCFSPCLGEFAWRMDNGSGYGIISSVLSVDTDGIDWEQSLIERPEGV